MPTKFKSPYATSFNSAVKRGTPCLTVLQNIAKRNNKTFTFVFNSLKKDNLVNRQKFNGQWVYWAWNAGKGNSTITKTCQFNMWQNFIDWCLASGYCTPKQIQKHCASQQAFMSFFKKFWTKQFTQSSAKSTTKRRTAPKSAVARKSTPRTNNYTFATAKTKTTRRYSRAA